MTEKADVKCINCAFRRYMEPGPDQKAGEANMPAQVYCALLPHSQHTLVKGINPKTREPNLHTFMIRRVMASDDSCGFFCAGEPPGVLMDFVRMALAGR
jgi:hypothetical protein